MRISMMGTRGIPARYGGFETAIEEIGRRLVERGHQVMVYTRTDDRESKTHLGMERIVLPSLRGRVVETISHTFASTLHAIFIGKRPDVFFVFNAANAPLMPLLLLLRVPIVVHVDGLEWKRSKWGRFGRAYYLICERLSVQLASILIADARGIQKYYLQKYSASSEYVAYGAPDVMPDRPELLSQIDLEPYGYHLVVARMEPENHVDIILSGYVRCNAELPIVVVGSVPYRSQYMEAVRKVAQGNPRVRLLGAVWDQELLDQLYANSYTYIHGHSVGGTNPSLLRAMGAGAFVIAWDVDFNREIVRDHGTYFADADSVASRISDSETNSNRLREQGSAGKKYVLDNYEWDSIALQYESLAEMAMSRASGFGRP